MVPFRVVDIFDVELTPCVSFSCLSKGLYQRIGRLAKDIIIVTDESTDSLPIVLFSFPQLIQFDCEDLAAGFVSTPNLY